VYNCDAVLVGNTFSATARSPMDVRSHRRWSTTEKPWVAALLSKYAWRLVVASHRWISGFAHFWAFSERR
jgi:hypothetical protein